MQDFTTRQSEIKNIYAAIGEERQTQSQKLKDETNQKTEAYIESQVTKMIENNPEWADESKLKTAFTSMGEFTTGTYGFTQEEFNNVTDARLVEVIKDAQKYRSGLKIADKKLVKRVPKYQKSTNKPLSKKVTKLDTLTKKAKNAKTSQKRDLQSDAIAELLTNGG